MSKKFTLTLTEPQAILVKNALEEYFRIRLNQWGDLADSLASKNLDFSIENPHHEKIFDRYIYDCDTIQTIFECVGNILWSNSKNPKTEEQLIAEDIWQVIRYTLFKSNNKNNDSDESDNYTWTVDRREPIQWSKEPLPTMEEVKVNE